MFLIKLISPVCSSSMLNQKQPDCNTFTKELAQRLLVPLQYRGCDADLGTAITNTGLASRRMFALQHHCNNEGLR